MRLRSYDLKHAVTLALKCACSESHLSPGPIVQNTDSVLTFC